MPLLMPPTKKPQWDVTPMPDGTLLLIADQGSGDAIQFGRSSPGRSEGGQDHPGVHPTA
jgi:hypothetical protein